MTAEVMNLIQTVFYAVVVIMLMVALGKLERIATLLSEGVQYQNRVGGKRGNAEPGTGISVTATDDEIAAVLAVIAQMFPDKKVTAVRMVSQ